MDMPRFVRTHRRRKEGKKKGDCHPRPASSSDLIIYIFSHRKKKGDPSGLQRDESESEPRKPNTIIINDDDAFNARLPRILVVHWFEERRHHSSSPPTAAAQPDDPNSLPRCARAQNETHPKQHFNNQPALNGILHTMRNIYVNIYHVCLPMSGLVARFQSSVSCFV